MLFEVPADRLSDLRTELLQWTQFSTFTWRQLQLLLGKLSFVTACVRPGWIFMSRLLNCLAVCLLSRHVFQLPVTLTGC